MIAVLVYSVVRRHMKRTSPGAFTMNDGKTAPPVTVELGPDEALVGWYRNPPPWENSVILFTSSALHVSDGDRIDRVAVEDIVGYQDPKSKSDVTGVRVLTKNGFRFVRIAGSFGPNGNQKDAYSFIMLVRALVPGVPVVADEAP